MERQKWRSMMFNNHDEMYEVSDLDEDIESRKALIEEIKAIDINADLNKTMREIADVKRRWKRISYWESAYEEALMEEFESYVDAFYAKRNEGFLSVQAMKRALIEEACKLSTTENWNQASEAMSDLMVQWKEAGSAGKEDDALWEEFKAARQTFYDRKHAYWENRQAQFDQAYKCKQELIQEASALADSNQWQHTSNQFRELMDRWKAAGSAGRKHEDALWDAFNEQRQKFYKRRDVHYEELHEEQEQKYIEKKGLVDQARDIASSEDYSRGNTDKMKNLGAQWKKIGSCGKHKEDALWKEFHLIMDTYFAGLKQKNEQRHAEWRQRMMEKRSRKLDLIQNQKRQVKRMEDEIVGLLGQRAIDEMEGSIADKEDFIGELEEQVEEIEKALEEK